MGCALAEIIGDKKLHAFSGFQEYGGDFKSTSRRNSCKYKNIRIYIDTQNLSARILGMYSGKVFYVFFSSLEIQISLYLL